MPASEISHFRYGNEDPAIFPHPIRIPVSFRAPSGEYREMTDKLVVFDNVVGKPIGILSDKYELVPHQLAIQPVEQVLEQVIPEYGIPEVTTEFSPDRAKMVRTYRFPDVGLEVKKNDLVNPSFSVHNSLDGNWSYRHLLGAFRVVCSNGLTVGEEFYSYSKRHRSGVMDFNVEDIREAIAAMDQQLIRWQEWTQRSTSVDKYVDTIQKLGLGVRAIKWIDQEIERQVGAAVRHPDQEETTDEKRPLELERTVLPPLDYWTFYNVLTAYTTHQVRSIHNRVALGDRLRQAA